VWLPVVSVRAKRAAFALGSVADASITLATASAALILTTTPATSSLTAVVLSSSARSSSLSMSHFPDLVVDRDAVFGGKPLPDPIGSVKITGLASEQPSDLTQTPTESKAVAAVVDTKLEPKIKAIKKKRKRSSSESGATRRNVTGYGTRRTCGCRRQI